MSASQASCPGSGAGVTCGQTVGPPCCAAPRLRGRRGVLAPPERQGPGGVPSGLRGPSVFEGRWPLHPGTRVRGQRGSVQLQRPACWARGREPGPHPPAARLPRPPVPAQGAGGAGGQAFLQ